MAGALNIIVNERAQKIHDVPTAALNRPIDLVHLSKYTMGDKDLEGQVLKLFATQSAIYIERLREAKSDREWLEAVHTLKGSASGVGAWRVAKHAGEVERLEGTERKTLSAAAIRQLGDSVDEVNKYIKDLEIDD